MALKTLTKQPRESRLYDFNFSKLLRDGDTIVSVMSVDVAPDDDTLTVGLPITDNEYLVQVRVSSGTADVKYKLSVLVQTVLGDAVELDGYLKVVET